MNILDRQLKAIKRSSLERNKSELKFDGVYFGNLDFFEESRSEILDHDPVGSCEEGEHVFDEMLLVTG